MTIKILGIVVAGGKGSRLAPLTQTSPKHLLPIGDAPILSHVLDSLAICDDVIVAVQYQGAQIIDFVANQSGSIFNKCTVIYDHELGDEEFGPWGVIIRHLSGREFDAAVIWFGDVFCKVDVEAVLAQHLKIEAYITAVTSPATATSQPWGVFTERKNGVITDYTEKPVSIGDPINVGIYVLSPQALSTISGLKELPLAEAQAFPLLLSSRRFYSYAFRGYHRNINTPTDLLHAHLSYCAESLRGKDQMALNCLFIGKSYISHSADIDFCIIADGSRVEGTHRYCLINDDGNTYPLDPQTFLQIRKWSPFAVITI